MKLNCSNIIFPFSHGKQDRMWFKNIVFKITMHYRFKSIISHMVIMCVYVCFFFVFFFFCFFVFVCFFLGFFVLTLFFFFFFFIFSSLVRKNI